MPPRLFRLSICIFRLSLFPLIHANTILYCQVPSMWRGQGERARGCIQLSFQWQERADHAELRGNAQCVFLRTRPDPGAFDDTSGRVRYVRCGARRKVTHTPFTFRCRSVPPDSVLGVRHCGPLSGPSVRYGAVVIRSTISVWPIREGDNDRKNHTFLVR